VRRELVGLDRVLTGSDLAALGRLAERRDLARLWAIIVAGIGPAPTVLELLAAADRRGRHRDALAFAIGVGLVLEQLVDDDQGDGCEGCAECS
jgi:hypothetical protein